MFVKAFPVQVILEISQQTGSTGVNAGGAIQWAGGSSDTERMKGAGVPWDLDSS